MNLLQNPDFETQTGGNLIVSLPDFNAGDDPIDWMGWDIINNNTSFNPGFLIDASQSIDPPGYYNAFSGDNVVIAFSRDNGGTSGLSQTFQVYAGVTYQCDFAQAPGTKWNTNSNTWTDVPSAGEGWQVDVTGAATFSQFYPVNPAHLDLNPGAFNPTQWTSETFMFTPAADGLATISFETTPNNTALESFLLDDVFLRPISTTCMIEVISATPTACNTVSNCYDLEVALTYSMPATGDIQISVADTFYHVTPDGSGSETFTLIDLPAKGVQPLDVTAFFINNDLCTHTLTDAFTPPPGCRTDLVTEDPCANENGVVVDLLGNPIVDDNVVCVDVTSEGIDPAQADSLLLWVFSRGARPTSVTFTSDNGLNINIPSNQAVAAGGNGFYFRTLVAADGSTNYCAQTAGNNQNNERSFGTFVYHSPPDGDGAVSTTFVGEYLFWNSSTATDPGTEDCLTRTVNVAAGDEAMRDIVVQIAVDDLEAGDPRTIDFDITAGGVNVMSTESGPTFALGSLGIYEFTLMDVPQAATMVEIEVCSRQANNGQSLFFTGVVADGTAGCANDCELFFSNLSNNCVDNNDGTFTTNYSVEVNWSGEPGSQNIIVTLDGNTIQTLMPTSQTSPQTVQFSVAADGEGSHHFRAAFENKMDCDAQLNFKAPVPCPADVAPCTNMAGCLGGSVFEDFNCNGTDDTNEPGVQGIQIQIYDCNNALVETTYSDAEGDWQVCGLTDLAAYRVEFILPENIACWATPTHVAGGGNQSDVQFLTAPACTQFSVSSPADFCEANPRLVISCYENGEASTNMNPAIISFSYDASGLPAAYDGNTGTNGTAENPMSEVRIDEIGAVNGSAWQARKSRLFSATFLKRFVGFLDGPGFIYVTEFTNNSATGVTKFDLQGVNPTNGGPAIDFGTVCRDASCASDPGNTGFASDYELANAPNQASIDLDAFAKVGAMSYGDIDLQEDGSTLWAVNLFQKALISIDVSGTTGTLPGAVNQYLLSDLAGIPTCSNGEIRPWGLAFNKGRGYLGVICDGSISLNSTDLEAYVLEFDPNNISTGFTTVLNFSLDFPREIGHFTAAGSPTNMDWLAWAPDWNTLNPFTSATDNNFMAPQPILADIEFNERDDMILGFIDRFGHQNGRANRIAVSQTTQNGDTNSGGDIVHACYNGTSWDLEGTGGCMDMDDNVTGDPFTQLLQNDGPNNAGEFYFEDYFTGDTTNTARFDHGETATGLLTLIKGKREVISTHYDPLWGPPSIVNAQGIVWHDTYTGEKRDGYQVVESSGSGTETFAKANGLGDFQAMCGASPLEIGNYVWCDSIQNGIQDACERGINNILVQLFDRNGNLVGQDTTSNSGQYYFNENNVDTTGITVDGSGIATPVSGNFTGMSFTTQYFIVFGNNQFTAGEFDNGSEMFGITSMANAGSNDNIDSDVDGNNLSTAMNAMPAGLPFIDMTTSAMGCGDHKYDMGVTCQEELFSLGNRVFSDDDNSGDQNGAEAGIDGVTLQLLNDDGSVYDSDPNTAGDQPLTVTTANGGYYRFDDLPAGDYIVEVLAANFNNGNSLDMFESSTGANQEADPESNGDLNDNGLDTPVAGAIRSGIIMLAPNEPTGEAEPATYGAGSTTGTAAADAFSNLTVDFGFYPIPVDNVFPRPGFPPCPNQPCHVVNNDLRMGATLSADPADGSATDDSDGTIFPNNLRAGTTINVRTDITNNTGSDAHLYAWVDWNNDDDFDDPGENFIVETYPFAMFSGNYEVSNAVFIPSSTSTSDEIAMRFRLSTDQNSINSPCAPAGCAPDGEVEDYIIMLECPQTICLPPSVQINRE